MKKKSLMFKKTGKKRIEKQAIIFFAALLLAVFVITVRAGNGKIDYSKHLDDIIFTVDGDEVDLRTLGYYIMKTEENVDEMAAVYDITDTYRFWNLHINHTYITTEAKEAVINTCIRDEVYVKEALKNDITLDKDELLSLEDDTEDELEGMSYIERKVLKYDYDQLYSILEKTALARKYALYMVETADWEDYNESPAVAVEVGGEFYDEILSEHEININEKLWKKIRIGYITIQKYRM